MNTTTAAKADFRALHLNQAIDTPWLAIRPSDQPSIENVVVVMHPRRWAYIEHDSARLKLPLSSGFAPLADFGVACTLYPHTRVLSVRLIRLPRSVGGRAWVGNSNGVSRVRVHPSLWDAVAEAAASCNAEHGLNAYGAALHG